MQCEIKIGYCVIQPFDFNAFGRLAGATLISRYWRPAPASSPSVPGSSAATDAKAHRSGGIALALEWLAVA